MRVALCTLCLNEMEWLPKLYQQHKDWPGLTHWVFVEGADAAYAQANPDMVSPSGNSVDGTSEFLRQLRDSDPRVSFLQLGFFGMDGDPAQGKVRARQAYLDQVRFSSREQSPDYFMVLDADEFYSRWSQKELNRLVELNRQATGFIIKRHDIWRPPSIVNRPLFESQVVGGFWDILSCHCWRWVSGIRYGGNHNTPEANGLPAEGRNIHVPLNAAMMRLDRLPLPVVECCHMGFASSLRVRQAKHAYYRERGEGRTDRRGWYVESRRAWESWKPGDHLPRGARVVSFQGEVPECFR